MPYVQPYTPFSSSPGATGSNSNLVSSVASTGGQSAGNGSVLLNPVGQTPPVGGVPGGSSSPDGGGGGVVSGVDFDPNLNSGINCSGPNTVDNCMTDTQLNYSIGNADLGGDPESMGNPGTCDGTTGNNGSDNQFNPNLDFTPTAFNTDTNFSSDLNLFGGSNLGGLPNMAAAGAANRRFLEYLFNNVPGAAGPMSDALYMGYGSMYGP